MADDNPQKKTKAPASMSMIDPRFRRIYMAFYKESYYTPTALDLKTKELIAIAASAVAKCQGCLEGHIKKALELGLTRDEISDAIVVAIGIAAAGVMDMTDRAAIELDIHHFEDDRKPASDGRQTPASASGGLDESARTDGTEATTKVSSGRQSTR